MQQEKVYFDFKMEHFQKLILQNHYMVRMICFIWQAIQPLYVLVHPIYRSRVHMIVSLRLLLSSEAAQISRDLGLQRTRQLAPVTLRLFQQISLWSRNVTRTLIALFTR